MFGTGVLVAEGVNVAVGVGVLVGVGVRVGVLVGVRVGVAVRVGVNVAVATIGVLVGGICAPLCAARIKRQSARVFSASVR